MPGLVPGPAETLLANSQLFYDCTIPVCVLCLQVIQKAATLSDHSQQASARVMVFGVDFEMLGQIVNPLAQEGDLYLGRTRIRIMSAIGID